MNNIILFVTFLAIVWYSIETRRLANLTDRQIRINIRPVLCVKDIDSHLTLKNIGNNSALNIHIDKITKISSRDSNNRKYNFIFSTTPYLLPQEECFINITPETETGSYSNINVGPCLNPNNPNFLDPYRLSIKYTDIEGGKWESIIEVNSKSILFKETKAECIIMQFSGFFSCLRRFQGH